MIRLSLYHCKVSTSNNSGNKKKVIYRTRFSARASNLNKISWIFHVVDSLMLEGLSHQLQYSLCGHMTSSIHTHTHTHTHTVYSCVHQYSV